MCLIREKNQKLLSILGATGLIASAGSNLVSCGLLDEDSITVKDFDTDYTGDGKPVFINNESFDQTTVDKISTYPYEENVGKMPIPAADADWWAEDVIPETDPNYDLYKTIDHLSYLLSEIYESIKTWKTGSYNHSTGHTGKGRNVPLFEDKGDYHVSGFRQWFTNDFYNTNEGLVGGFTGYVWKNWDTYKEFFQHDSTDRKMTVTYSADWDVTYTSRAFPSELASHKMSELFSEGSITINVNFSDL